MTFYQGLATVLLKVWAAGSLIFGILYLGSFGLMLLDPSNWTQPNTTWQFTNVAIYALQFGVGVALWFAARPLGKSIGRAAAPAPNPQLGIDAEMLVVVGSFLIGINFLVEYGPRAVMGTVSTLYENMKRADHEPPFSGGHVVRDLAGPWAIVVAACLLAFGARGMGRLFGWLRQAGLSKTEPTQP